MKKIISLLVILTLVFVATGCNSKTAKDNNKPQQKTEKSPQEKQVQQ